MARVDTTAVEVLQSVLIYLQARLKLGVRECYLVARPADVPLMPPGGEYWLTVAMGAGQFVPEEQDDGNVTEDTEITVSIYTRIRTDSTGHDEDLLLDASRGLFPLKQHVMYTLVGEDLQNSSGDTYLRQLMHVRRSEGPDIVMIGTEGVQCGVLRLTFGVSFDWLLA